MTTAYDVDKLVDVLKTTLRALTFADSKEVFGERSVIESAAPPIKAIDARRTPLAQINTSDRSDEDSPGIRYVSVTLTIYAIDRRDDAGEAATGGAADGKGLRQIARKVELAIQALGRATVPIRNIQRSSGKAQLDGGETLAYRVLEFEATCAVEAE